MRCDELNRWLDDGAPGADPRAAAARAHAGGCPACARSLAAHEALERALALPAPSPPNAESFTARVMARVEPLERLLPAAPRPAAPPQRIPWWLALLSEPAFAVAFVAALLLATTPAALRMEAGQSLAIPLTVASETLGNQFSQAIQTWLGPLSPATHLSPSDRLFLLIGFAPLLVWAGVWLYGAIERFVRGAAVRRG